MRHPSWAARPAVPDHTVPDHAPTLPDHALTLSDHRSTIPNRQAPRKRAGR